MRAGELLQFVDAGEDVLERTRPAAAVSRAAVLQVPGSHPPGGKVRCQRFPQPGTVLRAPVAAVDHHHHALVSPACGQLRQEKLAPLAGVRAVLAAVPLYCILVTPELSHAPSLPWGAARLGGPGACRKPRMTGLRGLGSGVSAARGDHD